MKRIDTIIGLLTIIANIGIAALCLKLYTEYFKDRSIKARAALGGEK